MRYQLELRTTENREAGDVEMLAVVFQSIDQEKQ